MKHHATSKHASPNSRFPELFPSCTMMGAPAFLMFFLFLDTNTGISLDCENHLGRIYLPSLITVGNQLQALEVGSRSGPGRVRPRLKSQQKECCGRSCWPQQLWGHLPSISWQRADQLSVIRAPWCLCFSFLDSCSCAFRFMTSWHSRQLRVASKNHENGPPSQLKVCGLSKACSPKLRASSVVDV